MIAEYQSGLPWPDCSQQPLRLEHPSGVAWQWWSR